MEFEGVEEENQVLLDSKPMEQINPDEKVEREWEMWLRNLREAQRRTSGILGKSRISNQAKAEVEDIWTRVIEEVGEFWGKSQGGKQLHSSLEREIAATLSQRGIKDAEDWREYMRTMEQDGEVIAEICEILNTDVSEVKKEVSALKKLSLKGDIERRNSMDQSRRLLNEERYDRLEAMPLGNQNVVGPSWQPSPSFVSMRTPAGDANFLVIEQLLTHLRSMACVDPGVYSGTENEDFEEFLRRFKRKYEKVIRSDSTMVEILGDDHLAGRAKSIFAALPRATKEQGLDAVTREMARLLSRSSTAGRMRALTELRNLKMRPNQEVAEFCITLEKLGEQANPDCTIEDRSLEYAQILLDSLSHWPEHFQLVGALHRVDARRAYEEVKQLALSIEQSKIMFSASKRAGVGQWKNRAAQYHDCGDSRRSQEAKSSPIEPDYFEEEIPSARENNCRSEYNAGPNRSVELHMQTGHSNLDRQCSPQGSVENRKCYRCSKLGHIAKDCPQQSARVNQLKGKLTVSEIIRRARNLGMTVKERCGNLGLIGGRIVKQLRLLGGRSPALIDTGSMISVVPVEVLAKARDRGFDVDALKLVQKSQLAPVWDASNKRMDFLGAVYVEVELEGGHRGFVPFYISPNKNDEILLGTNALSKLGVRLSVVSEKEVDGGGHAALTSKMERTVVRRVYVLPRKVGRGSTKSNGDPTEVERVARVIRRDFAQDVHSAQNQKVVEHSSEGRADAGRRKLPKTGKSKLKVEDEPARDSASEISGAHRGVDEGKQHKEAVRYRVGLPRPGTERSMRASTSARGGMSERDMLTSRDQL